jgi:protein O-mannosyl-transferase
MKLNNNFLAVSILFAVVLLSYANIFFNDFVWDDHVYILDNPDVRSISNIKLFFTQDTDGLYRPIRSIYYTLIYPISGKNEFLYHVSSLFLHAIITILVFLIVSNLVNQKNIAFLSALIFAVHPIHTERVTNITASFDMLGILFMLLSFYLFIRFSKTGLKKYILFSMPCFVISLLSSEEAVTLPFLILLYEFCFDREKFSKQSIKNNILNIYAPFFIISAAYVVLRFFILGIRGRVEEYLAGTFYLTMLTMLKVFASYIYLLVFPVKLVLFPEVQTAASFFDPKVLVSAFILITILFFALRFHKNKLLLFSVFWFFITLAPVSNIIPLQVFMAERYLYVPSIAFSLLVAYLLVTLQDIHFDNAANKKILKYSVVAFTLLLLVFYSGRTIVRNMDWRNDVALWSKTVETNPNSSRVHDNLGFAYERSGKMENAFEEFAAAVKLNPDDYRALANLGTALANFGLYNESVTILNRSIQFQDYYKTRDKLGLVYAKMGMEKEAIEQFKKAIELNPRYAKAHNDLATVYGTIGEFYLARQEFNEAIGIDRDYADAHYNLGVLLEGLGEKGEAISEFEIALRLEPDNKKARIRLDSIKK